MFTIQFQPSGFHRLFRVPMSELTDRALDARLVLGPPLAELERKLVDAPDFNARVQIASQFFLEKAAARGASDPVAQLANRVLRNHGVLHIGGAAAASGLSIRQFERRFRDMVGIAPRRYARVVRFNATLQAKVSLAGRNWTDIAHEMGYYDQMHMVHEFRHFAGESPTGWHRRSTAIRSVWS